MLWGFQEDTFSAPGIFYMHTKSIELHVLDSVRVRHCHEEKLGLINHPPNKFGAMVDLMVKNL